MLTRRLFTRATPALILTSGILMPVSIQHAATLQIKDLEIVKSYIEILQCNVNMLLGIIPFNELEYLQILETIPILSKQVSRII